MDDEVAGETINTHAYDTGPEIPSRLYQKVYENYENLISAQVQVKRGQSWQVLRKRLRFEREGPPQYTVDEICTELILIALEDAENSERDSQYRALLNVRDANKGTVKRFAPILAQHTADGTIEILDAPEMNERDQIGIFRDMLAQQMNQNTTLFQHALDANERMGAKVGDMADKVGDQCEKMGQLADGFSALASGMNSVLTNSAAFFNAGIELSREREQESTTLALARMEHESEQAKLNGILQMFGPAGQALAGQIVQSFAKKKNGASATPKGLPAPTNAESGKPTDSGNMGERLHAFLNKLTGEQRGGAKEILGHENYDALTKAAEDKDDAAAREALLSFRRGMDEIANKNRWEAMGRLAQLNTLLGNELTQEFGEMLPDPERTPETKA